MPAKGWRKDDKESNLDTLVENDAGTIDQFLFPKSTLNKLAKQILQQTNDHPMLLAKDSQMVIQRGSLLFVNFIYHHAKQIVKTAGRKVVNADDILKALSEVGFQDFIPVLNDELDKFVKRKGEKKLEKQNQLNKQQRLDDFDPDDTDEISQEPNKKMKLVNIMNEESQITSLGSSPGLTSDQTELEQEEEEEEGEEDELEEEEVDDDDDDDELEENENDGQIAGLSQLQKEQKELAGADIEDDHVESANEGEE